MKQIINLATTNLYHIISEPGDCTRYDYFVYRDGTDNFCFMPCKSTFRFPQRLNYYDAQDFKKDIDNSYKAVELGCNIWTLKECIRTMEELHEKQ